MTIDIPSLDAKYLFGLSDGVLSEIKKLTEGCPQNTIRNKDTNNCVQIHGVVAKKIIKALVASSAKPSPKKSCAVPTYPIAKKPIAKKAQPQAPIQGAPIGKTILTTGVKCSAKSKFAKDVDYICNPATGSWIKKGGPTYNKLLKDYSLQDLEDFKQLIVASQ
jgi:hypothetical protein